MNIFGIDEREKKNTLCKRSLTSDTLGKRSNTRPLKISNKYLRIYAFIYGLSRKAAHFDKFVPSTFENALPNASLSPAYFKPN